MKRPGSRWVAVGALLSLLPQVGWAQTPEATKGAEIDASLGAGLQARRVEGSLEKFQEYRDVPRGFLLNELRLGVGATGRSYLELEAKDALQTDQRYQLSAGRHGKYQVSVLYDATPHNFSSGRFLWNGFGSGRLQIADVAQGQLEANEQLAAERGPGSTDPNQDTTGEDAIQQQIVRGLSDVANDVVFRVEREKTGASLRYQLTEDADAWVRVTNENRRGARVISAGTYERWSQGSGLGHLQDRFVVAGADLAEPIDYRTLGVGVGAGVQKKRWLAEVDYSLTQFRSFHDTLQWENPFRFTDAAASGASGAFDRGRFAAGQIVLPPDSLAHDITASGALDVPLEGKLAASLSFGLITQDEPFAPYTLNSAIQASDETGPLGSAAELALPQRDLNGLVRNLAGQLSLSLRPVEPVGVDARYRYYLYDGRSSQITFPGYAAFGESFWRRVKNDPGSEVRNENFDYTRQNAELGVQLRLANPLTASLEGQWEGHDFNHLRIDRMNELGLRGGLAYRPSRTLRLTGGYGIFDRRTDPYLQGATPANPEARGLVNFNWAERRRQQADLRFQASPTELLSFGLSLKATDARYSGSSEGIEEIDQFRYGRTHLQSALGVVDISVTPGERFAFYGSYAREYRQEQMNSAAKDDPQKDPLGLGDQFTAANAWNSNLFERINTVGLGATVQAVPDRVIFDASYHLSLSDMDVSTLNPNGVSELTLLNAVAQSWPRIRNRLHQVSADVGYQIAPEVRAGVHYLFDWYELDDFAWRDLEPSMAGITPENSTRYLFADATYRGYAAHVGSLYLAARF